MKPLQAAVLWTALAGAAGAAQAQSTLGDLLDRGASKLTPAEVASIGPLRIVREAPDSDALMTLRPGGTVVGTVHNKQGHGSSEASGTWSVDATGKRCVDVELPAFRMNWKQCGYLFRLGEQIYASASDTDRSVPVAAHAGTVYLTR
jgi:hypothetical protein